MPAVAQSSGGCAWVTLGLLALTLRPVASGADPPNCESSFYGHAPPAGVAQSGLRVECHELTDGRSFTTLHDPGSGTAIYTAFHLSPHNGWGRGAAPEGDESWTEDAGEESAVFVPALYKRGRNAAPPAVASPLHKIDSLTAEVVGSRVIPQCSNAGGDVYVQSGVGGLNGFQAGVLWSVACCVVPDGTGSFSEGMIQEGDEELRTVTVKELEELVGVQEMFSGGCGESGGQEVKVAMSFMKEGLDSSQAHNQDLHVAEVGKEQTTRGGEEEETSLHATELEDKPELEETTEAEESSILLRILSSIASILCIPFSVVASTLANLLSRFTYVLWEDATVLAAVPFDSLTLTQNIASDVASGVGGAWDIVYKVGKMGVCSVYNCVSTLSITLLFSCQEGLVGTGTLACDVLGLVIGVLEEGWDVGVAVVGWVGQQLGVYLGTVTSEMMQQSRVVGEGVGTLVWRSQRGVGFLLYMLQGIMGGVVDRTIENVQEAFGGE
ncbi:uncharacterized protein LOC143493048 [Brachyhypopomus gauderio]|uniref:uncharacterized protein LOC143493048 n=1 Tax=Brachyhypopomus gauderio TaxID=698409 RepID=UPI0040415595